MIVQPFGSSHPLPNLTGSTLVVPCHSAGLSPFIGLDLFILNEGLVKIGYYKSEYIAAGLSNDGLSVIENTGNLTLPAEVYHSDAHKVTFLIIRSGVYSGKHRLFGEELKQFVKQNGFSQVIVLSSTLSPVTRERDSNRQIPEVFAYANKHIIKQDPSFYENQGFRKFGYWLQDVKKKPEQELDELMMAGSAKSYIRLFNKVEIPASLFIIFTPGAIDFVGGYTFYTFLKNYLQASQSSLAQKQGGKVVLDVSSGEAVHEKLFQKKEVKTPAYWSQVVQYF